MPCESLPPVISLLSFWTLEDQCCKYCCSNVDSQGAYVGIAEILVILARGVFFGGFGVKKQNFAILLRISFSVSLATSLEEECLDCCFIYLSGVFLL
jgi:hypothetical protein